MSLNPIPFPLPRMDDCVDCVGAAVYISKFHLLKGYWQVPLSKRAQETSAFITPSGLYSYCVMPFGLRNAPATFQRLMNKVVGVLDGCAVYLDDVVVYSDNWSDHIERVRALFDRLAEAHLTVNLAKCEFAKATVTYLGRQVGHGEVRPLLAKVQAIEQYPQPVTKKELMRPTPAHFSLRRDRLYRVSRDTTQLVVPKSRREIVFQTAHYNPMAVHMGCEKTLNRVMARFYWPGIWADVRRWCASCPECQLVNQPAIPRAPLRPLPLMEVPFEHIGMDLIGPFHQSARGYRFVLVLVDYATRYPEAVPLPPECGAGTVSSYLPSLPRLLGIKSIRTTTRQVARTLCGHTASG